MVFGLGACGFHRGFGLAFSVDPDDACANGGCACFDHWARSLIAAEVATVGLLNRAAAAERGWRCRRRPVRGCDLVFVRGFALGVEMASQDKTKAAEIPDALHLSDEEHERKREAAHELIQLAR